MSVLWSVVDENGSHELDDDALLTLEIALQSNAPRVAIDVSDDIGYLLDLDLREMTCLQNPNVHLHRRQSLYLHHRLGRPQCFRRRPLGLHLHRHR